ncbi:death domain-associated protein 6-like [Paramacrobiotus metropolitanus]|uniref:death domain-associated protein 6-like n=1 Tax=Paramacrobiotus metropolitanus TaxID=2943436 RepID=UPI0024462EB4|nr:death domain-associated protein 6-like [Paramacrobiotus metropolitanus]
MAKTELATASQSANAPSIPSSASGVSGESLDPPPLYPPLNIPEPHISEKKKESMEKLLRYRQSIDAMRASRFNDDVFKPTKYFCPPDFSAKKSRSGKKAPKKLQKSVEDAEKRSERDGEDPGSPKAKPAGPEDEEAKDKEEEDEEEDTNVKSDSDVDDYTAGAEFEDDEGGFEEGGMDNEHDTM